jgi:hypothetical protein
VRQRAGEFNDFARDAHETQSTLVSLFTWWSNNFEVRGVSGTRVGSRAIGTTTARTDRCVGCYTSNNECVGGGRAASRATRGASR